MDPVSVVAVIVSVLALGVSIYFGWCTRDHNRRSVKPLPYVAPNDYEDYICVRLWNYGSGPMVLSEVIARHSVTHGTGHIIKLVPDPPDGVFFSDYVEVEPGRAVLPGESLDLLALSVDEGKTKEAQYRDQLRDFLGNVTVSVSYKNIYDCSFPVYERTLEWYHRGGKRESHPKTDS